MWRHSDTEDENLKVASTSGTVESLGCQFYMSETIQNLLNCTQYNIALTSLSSSDEDSSSEELEAASLFSPDLSSLSDAFASALLSFVSSSSLLVAETSLGCKGALTVYTLRNKWNHVQMLHLVHNANGVINPSILQRA